MNYIGTYRGTVTSSGTNRAAGGGGGGVGRAGKPVPKQMATVNTSPGVSVSADVSPAPTPAKPPEEQRYDRVKAKVHPTVLALIDRLRQKDQSQSAVFDRFVRDGKAEVQVWFIGKTEALRVKLKELGFEVVFDSPSSSLMIGRVPVDKLELLVDLELVRYVAPQTTK